MGKNNNIIEINGKRYDARSGEPLPGHAPAHARPAAGQTSATPKKHGRTGVVRHPAHHATGHAPKTTRTLMRQAVKKPAVAAKHHGQAQGLVKHTPADIVISKSARRLDPKRLQTAKGVPKSELVTHFSLGTLTAPAPAAAAVSSPKSEAAPPAKPLHKAATTADVLEHALRTATSHQQATPAAKPDRPGRRTYLAGAGGAVLLVIGLVGLTVQQNLPGLKLEMATAKAGFSASVPGYKPAGFSLDEVNYSPGIVATSFHSNSDDERSYTIIQKRSTWDSAALRDQFVASRDKSYQTVEAAGRTVYIFDDHNATWVSSGVWYQIQSNGALSNRQLLQLATSL